MNRLFRNKGSCNPDIGDWDVSKVTNFVSQSIASMHVIFYLFISKTTKQSLTPFFCLSNIATTPIINNNTTLLRLLSQYYMFQGATAFNQDISSWDVSSGTLFVSGSGLWVSWSSRFFGS
jgi:surface protein